MAFERIRKVKKEISELIAVFTLGAGFALLTTHNIPYTYNNFKKPDPFPEDNYLGIFPSRKLWKESSFKDKLKVTAIYAGGLAGLVTQASVYYHFANETSPGVLAIPVATNTLSAVYELYKARKKAETQTKS